MQWLRQDSHLLLDMSCDGVDKQACMFSIYTTCISTMLGHVTTNEDARLWLWTLLWTLLWLLPPQLHVPPFKVATRSLRSQLYVRRKDIYKAQMPYPHLGPCTSGGMSMTITPPRGPTQKCCFRATGIAPGSCFFFYS